jgi:pimeloyl-ACP methyl ester carboxylesterase
MAADPAKPRLVLAFDYRGHGQSEYDRNPDHYTLSVALADLSAVLIALEMAPAIFVGTSYGGLLAMMLAAWRPTAIAGVILNDIGPVIEPQGWVRIKGYVGKLPVPRNFEEGADHFGCDASAAQRARSRRSAGSGSRTAADRA